MSSPFLAEIRVISFNFAPKGWALCNGQLLPINQNQALFSLLGTNYGGDGRVTFGLPNLQGRVPMHFGDGLSLGQLGGETSHTLSIFELPVHSHFPVGSSASADQSSPTNHVWGASGQDPYAPPTQANTNLSAGSIPAVGGNQPHQNMPPYLTLNFIIALQGIFPSIN